MKASRRNDEFLLHQIKSFTWALEGIVFSFNKGTHVKMQAFAALVVTILGFVLKISANEWLILILISSAVIATEVMNTALEETCNLLHPDLHPSARLAKHCAAGAVLVFSIAAVLISLIIFVPKL